MSGIVTTALVLNTVTKWLFLKGKHKYSEVSLEYEIVWSSFSLCTGEADGGKLAEICFKEPILKC